MSKGTSRFSRLLSPLTLSSGHTLRNRVMMGSMHTGLEEAKVEPYQRMAAYFGDRAAGGTGLIVTGGVAPNWEGKVHPLAGKMSTKDEASKYQIVTDAVHQYDGKIIMQILHAGRYAYSPIAVAPSSVASPIWKFNPMKPIGMPAFWIRKTIRDFANCAALAKSAGFDGIELMSSEGYLLNEFLVTHTNKRTDKYGGSYENRMQFPLEVLKAIREATGPDFIIMMRVSMLDLVPNGSSTDEVFEFAERVADSGATLINTGIGWHEARIPTIATSVPRAAFTWVTKRVRDHLRKKNINIPLVTTNRINTPVVAEEVLQKEEADIISMARPLLADADFVKKTEEGREREINVCIGCNQACLDHAFKAQTASCLVNPIACNELDLKPRDRPSQKSYLVIGGGPAGCQAAITLAEQGQRVTLFETTSRIGGQFHLAKQVPGKEEYESAIRYWESMMHKHRKLIDLRLHAGFDAKNILGFAEKPAAIILATGCVPRLKNSEIMVGLETNDIVADYVDVLTGQFKVGKRVAIIGSGGIGFDVAVFLSHRRDLSLDHFAKTWGIDLTMQARGGLVTPQPEVTDREIFMFQRSPGKVGGKLGATTGWIHRAALKHQNVKQIKGAQYTGLDGNTLHYNIEGKQYALKDLDTVVLCTGQRSNIAMKIDLTELMHRKAMQIPVIPVGGCNVAAELDAKKAIAEAHRVALSV